MASAKTLEIILKARDEASKVIKGVGDTVAHETSRFKQLTSTMRIAGAAITTASVGMAAGLAKMAESGGRLLDVERSFEALAKTVGKSSQELLGEFSAAVKGTVDNATMMKNAVRASMLGIPMDKMTALMKIARQQAVAMGEDMGYMLDSIVTGIGRASPLILDNLGITLKLGEVYEDAAAKLGKKATELTEAERKQALLNAVLEWGAQKEKELGGAVESNADAYMQLQANIKNLWNELKKALVPVLADVAKYVARVTNAISKADPKLIKLAAVVLAGAAAFGMIVGPIMFFVGMLPAFVSGIGMLASVFGTLTAAVGVVALPLGIIIGLLIAWKTNFLGIRDKVKAGANAIAGAFNKIKNTIKKVKDAVWGIYVLLVKGDFTGKLGRALGVDEDSPLVLKILNFRRRVLNTYKSIVNGLRSIVAKIGTVMGGLINVVEGAVSVIVGVVMDMWRRLLIWQNLVVGILRFVMSVFKVLAVVIYAIVYDIVAIIRGVLGPVFGWLYRQVEAAIRPIVSLVEWMVDEVKNGWNAVVGATQSMVNAVIGAINSLVGPVRSGWNAVVNAVKSGADRAYSFVRDHMINPVVGGVQWMKDRVAGLVHDMMQGIVNKINGFVGKVRDAIHNLANTITNAIRSVHIPSFHVWLEERQIGPFKLKVPKIAFYQFGGWVKNAGLAFLHPGEFVLSRGMIEGRRQVPPSVTYDQPITINAEIRSDVDIDMLGYKLAWILRNSR